MLELRCPSSAKLTFSEPFIYERYEVRVWASSGTGPLKTLSFMAKFGSEKQLAEHKANAAQVYWHDPTCMHAFFVSFRKNL